MVALIGGLIVIDLLLGSVSWDGDVEVCNRLVALRGALETEFDRHVDRLCSWLQVFEWRFDVLLSRSKDWFLMPEFTPAGEKAWAL